MGRHHLLARAAGLGTVDQEGMMIDFSREGTKLKLSVEAKTSVAKRFYTFAWECADEVYADLLMKNLKAHFEEKIQQARKESYEAGWRHAKAKVAKDTWFSGWL